MSDFENNATKIFIKSLDTGLTVTAQYNPKELQVDKSVPWSKVNEANKANAKSSSTQGIHLEFTGAEGRSLSVELLFDSVEGGARSVDVAGSVKDLETLASVIEPGSPQEDKRRPHRCVCTWGSTLDSFRCVIESLSTKYTMFDAKGAPLRATCTVKLKEADVVSMGKAK
jgi:phage protein U